MRRVVREVDAMDQAAVWPEHPLAFAEDGDQRVGRDVLEHRERHVRIDALIRKRESSRVGGRQILDAGEAHECGARAAEGEELVEAAEPGARGVVSEEGDESLRCGAEGGQVIPHEGEPEIAMDIDRDHALSTQEPKAQRYVQPPAGAKLEYGAAHQRTSLSLEALDHLESGAEAFFGIHVAESADGALERVIQTAPDRRGQVRHRPLDRGFLSPGHSRNPHLSDAQRTPLSGMASGALDIVPQRVGSEVTRAPLGAARLPSAASLRRGSAPTPAAFHP